MLEPANVRRQILLTRSLADLGSRIAESRGISFAAFIRTLIAAEGDRERRRDRRPLLSTELHAGPVVGALLRREGE